MPDGSRDGAACMAEAGRAAGRLLFRAAAGGSGSPEIRAIGASGLVALAILPVLLSLSVVLGKVVALPAALFVPLLLVARTASEGRGKARIAMAVPAVPVVAGLALTAWPGIDAIQPVAVNCALLAAFAGVSVAWRLAPGAREAGSPAAASTESRSLEEAIAAVEACSHGCAAVGIDRDLVCVAATREALRALDTEPVELIGSDIASRATLFSRPALIKALTMPRDPSREVTVRLEVAAVDPGTLARVYSARLRRHAEGGIVMVLEPAGLRDETNLADRMMAPSRSAGGASARQDQQAGARAPGNVLMPEGLAA